MVMEEDSEIFFMLATRRPNRGEEGVEDDEEGEACCIRLNVGSAIGYLSEGFRGEDDEVGVE